MGLKLYHYWRSSASWRVRWALAFKNIESEFVAVNLLEEEQRSAAHLERNPSGNVPVLETGDKFLAESLAIIEWLEENFPKPALLPGDSFQKARIRQLAELINAGTQPLHNRKVSLYYSKDEAEQKKWNAHWIRQGLGAYEELVKQSAGKFSVGDSVTAADLCLIPQCYGALRNEVGLEEFPTVARINTAALETAACQASHPDRFKE